MRYLCFDSLFIVFMALVIFAPSTISLAIAMDKSGRIKSYYALAFFLTNLTVISWVVGRCCSDLEHYHDKLLNTKAPSASSASSPDQQQKPTTTTTTSKEKPKGISVHYLQTQFLREVQDAGKSRSSKIYELEDLRSPRHGVIRSKGANMTCPRDGKTKGAAYIDTILGTEHVAPATFLLSYAWGYSIGDVVDSLVEWCKRFGRDPKDVYVWICCLCNNQHKVYNDKQSGVNVPFEEFHKIFRDTVVDIGHVVMMMSPFYDPIYIHRIWCIFEAYTAKINKCKMDLVMPPSAREEMVQATYDIDNIFKLLGTIKIENAEASVEEDRVRILKLVKDPIGYSKLNQTVTASMRGYIMDTLEILVAEMGREHQAGNQGEGDDAFGRLLFQLGRVMLENGEYEKALGYYKKSLDIRLKVHGENHADTAACHNDIGRVFEQKGEYDNAIKSHEKALAIRLKVLGENHPNTATSHNNLGLVFEQKGEYDNALKSHEKALEIHLKVLGENHPNTAMSHNNLGAVFEQKGEYDNALKSFEKALAICLKVLGENHPDTATSHNNLGVVFEKKGEYDNAIKSHEKALAICLKVLGENHPDTATSHNNIGGVFRAKGEYDNAIKLFEKALAIRLKVLGENHPDNATSHNNLGLVFKRKGDYDKALKSYEKALAICLKVHGENHPSTATSHHNIGAVFYRKGEYKNAQVRFQMASEICLKVLGSNHPSTVDTQQWLDATLSALK